MRNFMKNTAKKIDKMAATVGKTATNCMVKMQIFKANAKMSLCSQRGDQNLGTAVTILITVVIGALLLAGLYLLFDEVVMPTVSERIEKMFDYAGK